MKATRLALIVAGVLLIAYSVVSAYGAAIALPVKRVPITQYPEGMAYENVSFSVGQLVLRGWYFSAEVPREGKPAIIIINGGTSPRVDEGVGTLNLTRDLLNKGFSVLLFDMRGRGESDGKALMLVHTSEDINAAVEFLKPEHGSVSIIGYSMGAAETLIYASKETGIAAIVSDSCFTDIPSLIAEEAGKKGYPRWVARIFTPGILVMAKIIYGYNKVDPIDAVAKINCPVLFIHGEKDMGFPATSSVELKTAKDSTQDELWLVPGAGHCMEYHLNPDEYVNKVVDFLNAALVSDLHR